MLSLGWLQAAEQAVRNAAAEAAKAQAEGKQEGRKVEDDIEAILVKMKKDMGL